MIQFFKNSPENLKHEIIRVFSQGKMHVTCKGLILKNYLHEDFNISHESSWEWTSFNHVANILLGNKSFFNIFHQEFVNFARNLVL